MDMFNFLVSLFELNSYKSSWLKYAIDEYLLQKKDASVAVHLLQELKAYDIDTAAAFEFFLGDFR